ncbi:phosphorylase kinase alphabeta [Martensiomyces pterosporus]|nr:phosphorylase kinase alphabeta [Martensiomyces pterosporus]
MAKDAVVAKLEPCDKGLPRKHSWPPHLCLLYFMPIFKDQKVWTSKSNKNDECLGRRTRHSGKPPCDGRHTRQDLDTILWVTEGAIYRFLPAGGTVDGFVSAITATILSRQHPVTGLIPASVAITTHGNYQDAWVRDNVNSILAVYGLALAYRRVDDNQGRAYELEHAVVKLMRGLLFSMSKQSAKVERFKHSHSPLDALHAKYDTATGDTVVKDDAWGHLQIDATSLFLLMLAEMTANGMQIVFTYDEVDFVQNLVFYIEQAYSFGENGAWERGSKQNTGILELNSSSIGIVVGALRAMHGLNLFGARGGPRSVVHCFVDETTRCYQTLLSQLPRESNSKEIDGAILSAIGFPAFAVRDAKVCKQVHAEIVRKLRGRYGLKRFLKDGHQSMLEDNNRLHYMERELEVFKDIESEWPLFFTYIILGAQFTGQDEVADEYMAAMAPLLHDSKTLKPMYQPESGHTDLKEILQGSHFPLIPELYYVPRESIEQEKASPHSQARLPNENLPLVWANSLFFLGRLIAEGLLDPAELDPLNRRADALQATPTNNIVQVVLLSEDAALKDRLAAHGLETQTPDEIKPVRVLGQSSLVEVFARLGQNEKLGLTGRPARPLGTLATCSLYRMQGQLYAFTPNFLDQEDFYLNSDSDYLVSTITNELQFICRNYSDAGRPTLTLPLTHSMFAASGPSDSFSARHRSLLKFIMDLRAGACLGVRVRVGRMSEMIHTSHVESLDFLATSGPERSNPLLAACGVKSKDGRRTPALHGSSSGARTPTTPIIRVSSRQDMPSAIKTPIMHSDESTMSYFDLASALAQPARYKLREHQTISDDLEVLGISAPGDGSGEGERGGAADTSAANPNPAPVLVLQVGDSSQVGAAEEALASSANLCDQAELLSYLASCGGLEHRVHSLDATVRELLEEVYTRAVDSHLWNPVRTAAGLLHKRVPGLDTALAELAVRRKVFSVGYGDSEVFVKKPMSAEELGALVDQKYAEDVREAPIVQEIIKASQELVRAHPHIFDGILFLRSHEIVVALREEISRLLSVGEDEAAENLFSSTPSQVKTLLFTVLSGALLSSTNSFTMIEEDLERSAADEAAGDAVLGCGRSVHMDGYALPDLAGASELRVDLQSGGFKAGNFSRIKINGRAVLPSGRGLNVVAIDPVGRKIVDLLTFDTSASRRESDQLARFIDGVSETSIVLIAVQGDCAECLTPAARSAMEALGSLKIRDVRYRDSWCMVGHKLSCDLADTSVKEAYSPQDQGPTGVLTVTFALDKIAQAAAAGGSVGGALSIAATSESASLLVGPSLGRWLRRRKNDGALNRVPSGFFARVYKLLELSTGAGILVKGRSLSKDPLIYDKTPDELNFAFAVEGFLSLSVADPAERQVAVTVLEVLYIIIANAKVEGTEHAPLYGSCIAVDIDIYIQSAIHAFWGEWQGRHRSCSTSSVTAESLGPQKRDALSRRLFYDLPPIGRNGMVRHLAAAILAHNGVAENAQWVAECERLFSIDY